jgi:beta-phosphoglucomutase-like phosphatase (HAD superfamily)
MACATAGDPSNIAFALAGLGLEGFFDAAVGAYDVARGKPEPDLFLLAAARIGVAPAECLVFEDAPLGIEGARRAGMRAVAITSSLPAEELGAPHVIACASDFTGLEPSSLARELRSPLPRAGGDAGPGGNAGESAAARTSSPPRADRLG